MLLRLLVQIYILRVKKRAIALNFTIKCCYSYANRSPVSVLLNGFTFAIAVFTSANGFLTE